MRILLLNQCFYPDIVSTAQHLTDLAVALAERGHSVTVVASRRGYDDPSIRFPAREEWKGITIVRIPSLALGKSRNCGGHSVSPATYSVAYCDWLFFPSLTSLWP